MTAAKKPEPYTPMQTAAWVESMTNKALFSAERINHPRMNAAAKLLKQARIEIQGYFDEVRGKG